MDTSEETLLNFAASPEARDLRADRTFEELFISHYPRLVRILLRLTGNPAQAEELAADAFYKFYAWKGRPFCGDNPAGWLYRTAMNLAFDALRADSRRVRREEGAGRETLLNAPPQNPLNSLLAEERRDRVRAVLSQLKPVQGQVLLMGSSGYSSREIATLLGVKPDSLYVLIARAKAQFEKKYLRLYGRTQ
ncbi:MAG TPA: sigma-70 family RNA polymerase sigma factor [Bryobacteraceae bacterium]|nr:sigma-70 family RNA polymerase sigma factor [Bryobacteraceae bacterium]